MINIILILIANVSLFWLAANGQRYFNKVSRIGRARENASKRYRWSDGQFAKEKTYADMEREIKVSTKKRLIPVNYVGKLQGYINL